MKDLTDTAKALAPSKSGLLNGAVNKYESYDTKEYKCENRKICNFVPVAEKQRFNISLPEHVADELARRSKALGSNPTEYAADIIRWWYGEGSPALTTEEKRVQGEQKAPKKAS